MPYYARVQRISEATTVSLLPEAREALLAGGEFMAMREKFKDKPNIWGMFESDFYRMVSGAKAAARRAEKQSLTFAIPLDVGGRTSRNLGSDVVFIKLKRQS